MKWPWANIYSAIICITGVVDTCTTHTIVSPQQEIELIFGRRGQPSWICDTHDTVKGKEYARRNTYFRPEMRFPFDSRGGGRGEIFTSKLAYLRTQQTTTLVTYQREVSNRKLARTKLKQALARWIPPWSILKLLKFGNRHRFRQKMCERNNIKLTYTYKAVATSGEIPSGKQRLLGRQMDAMFHASASLQKKASTSPTEKIETVVQTYLLSKKPEYGSTMGIRRTVHLSVALSSHVVSSHRFEEGLQISCQADPSWISSLEVGCRCLEHPC